MAFVFDRHYLSASFFGCLYLVRVGSGAGALGALRAKKQRPWLAGAWGAAKFRGRYISKTYL